MANHTCEWIRIMGDTIKNEGWEYRPRISELQKFHFILIHPQNKRYELDAGLGWRRISENQTAQNITLDVTTPFSKHPISYANI